MEPTTAALGLGLGVVNMGLGMSAQNAQKKATKKMGRLDREMALRNKTRALEEMAHKEVGMLHQDERDKRAINEGANEREILDSSIVQDDQNERQYQLDKRLEAMQRERGDIDYEYQMLQKRQKIGSKLADATEWMSMLQSAINGGAMGVGAALGG